VQDLRYVGVRYFIAGRHIHWNWNLIKARIPVRRFTTTLIEYCKSVFLFSGRVKKRTLFIKLFDTFLFPTLASLPNVCSKTREYLFGYYSCQNIVTLDDHISNQPGATIFALY